MNIGETDADGWTYVRFGDAAKAAQEGAHDCETKHVTADEDEWKICYSFSSNPCSLYRIREKTRTITVTIPRPEKAYRHHGNVELVFSTEMQAINAWQAIRAAMEQS